MTNKEYSIKFEGEQINYELIRAKIKNLYIYIREGKVIVKAPIKLKEKEVYDFVVRKAKWIYQNINKEKTKTEEKIENKDVIKLELLVKQYIDKYSALLKIKPNQVRIRNIKYAWGSCSNKKNITINMKLANKNIKAIEYVVLHEMCHLKYMNHSKKFWDLVERYMPQYKEYKKMLRE